MSTIRADVDAEGARLTGRARVMVFGCMNTTGISHLRTETVGVVKLNCSGQLPPAFIDYVLSRNLADGVIVAGCSENACHNRFGINWTMDRLAGRRDPYLRARVPRERLMTVWAGRLGGRSLEKAMSRFAQELPRKAPMPRREKVHGTEEERSDA
jgi:coenzyme F420-reducing hydrogenase delta subunit